jgi:hypothetical protein
MAESIHSTAAVTADSQKSLRAHLQRQQDIANNICGIFEALSILDNEGCAPGAVTSLINVGRSLADDIAEALDIVNLPGVEA